MESSCPCTQISQTMSIVDDFKTDPVMLCVLQIQVICQKVQMTLTLNFIEEKHFCPALSDNHPGCRMYSEKPISDNHPGCMMYSEKPISDNHPGCMMYSEKPISDNHPGCMMYSEKPISDNHPGCMMSMYIKQKRPVHKIHLYM